MSLNNRKRPWATKESISIPKWVVLNTRNFYTFLLENKLSTQLAIQDYLAYTVKTMELIARFDWKSIFMYNSEFKKLQAIYKFSWSLDSTHLHMVLLQPIYKRNPTTVTTKPSASTTNQQTAFARFTPDGRVICRNFHGLKGCALLNCNFANVCNRKVAGKACAMSHPGFFHKVVEPPRVKTLQRLPPCKLTFYCQNLLYHIYFQFTILIQTFYCA